MSKREDTVILQDIVEAIERVETYTKGMSYQQFISDRKTQDAVVRNLEIVGEATKNLTEKTKQQNPDVSWKSMAGMRDKLIHDYFGVNYDVVWTIINEDLEELSSSLELVIEKLQSSK